MSQFAAVASELGVDERALRGAADLGAVRRQQTESGQVELAAGEHDYLKTHWELLRRMMVEMSEDANLSLAVLYGSVARGDEIPSSDIDLLVSLREDTVDPADALGQRVERAITQGGEERVVDVARLQHVERTAPLLLLYALNEGRVLVDADGLWGRLQERRSEIAGAAERQRARLGLAASESLRALSKLPLAP